MRLTNDEIAADLKEHVIKPVIPEQYLVRRPFSISTHLVVLSLVDLMVMLVSQAGRSLLTLMVAGEPMVVALSLARTQPRSTAVEPILQGKQPRALWLTALPAAALSRCHMPLVCLNHSQCLSTHMAQAKSLTKRS